MNFGLVKSSKGWLIPEPVMIAQNVLYRIFPCWSMPFSPKHPVFAEERICWRKVSRATFTWTDGIQGLLDVWKHLDWLHSFFWIEDNLGETWKLANSTDPLILYIFSFDIQQSVINCLTCWHPNPILGMDDSCLNKITPRYINIPSLNISRSNFWDLDVCQEYQEFKRAWKQAMRKQEIERIKVVKTRAGGHGVTWFVTAKLQRPEQGECYVYPWVCP